jgi:CheY-like chemotaxis protein
MPKKTGKQILVELRQLPRFENVPVILFTTSTLPSEKQFAQAYNATCITKPLYTTQIREAVDKMIDHCPEEVKKTIKGL